MYDRHQSGVIAEFKVAQFFVKKGYEIFFPMTTSVVDLIAMKGEELVRVQVKSAYTITRPSGASYIQATTRRNNGQFATKLYEKTDYDILAICFEDRLWLFPIDEVVHLQSIILEKGQQIRRAGKQNFDPSPFEIVID